MPSVSNQSLSPLLTSFWVIAGLLTLIRVLGLILSPAELGPDEAQYWFWSQTPAFGYFSKPPVIAWAIAVTTTLFGDAEWAVRLSAPLFHLGSASLLYLTAKKLFDQPIAFWTGLTWLTIPGVSVSSFLMTTDAPLLFFWSAALFFMIRIHAHEKSDVKNFAALGIAIGLGFLAKYAMIYFVIALGLSMIIIPAFRNKLLRKELLLTAIITLSLLSVNLWWNAANDFQTVTHTAANANWGSNFFKPIRLFAFFSEQFAVIGPILFGCFIWAFIRPRNAPTSPSPIRPAINALIIFALTPLAIVSVQAFISRAHANWAAAAYPAIALLVVAWLYEQRLAWLAKASTVLHAVFAAGFLIAITQFSLIDSLKLSGTFAKLRGWETQSHAITAMAEPYDAIMLDDRALMGAMLYHERDTDLAIVAIDPNNSTSHHYEAFMAFDPEQHSRVLFVTTREDAAHIDYRFGKIKALGPNTVSLGGNASRTYHLFDASDYFEPGSR